MTTQQTNRFDTRAAAEHHLTSKGFQRAYLNRWEKQGNEDEIGQPYTIWASVVSLTADWSGATAIE